VPSQWPGGFSANVTITNSGSTTINGWTLKFTFPGTQIITQLWNGQLTQTGSQVTVQNLSYNATIAPGGNVSFGFNGSWSGSNPSPTSFTLNGVPTI
jgi:cellulase/cellobiase CelA1